MMSLSPVFRRESCLLVDHRCHALEVVPRGLA
eukprot:SAG11_NODE_12712_length_689_cov_0.871186_1_plen_31_part_01